MERGGDRHFTADGSDPKSPCPAEANNVNCGLECSFPCVSTLLGGSMLSAPWGDAREQTRLAGISQDAKSLTRPRPVKVEADDVAGGDRSRERAGFAFPSRLPPGDAVPQSLVHAFAVARFKVLLQQCQTRLLGPCRLKHLQCRSSWHRFDSRR